MKKIFDQQLSYVTWVMQHQAENLAFVRLTEYAKKMELSPAPKARTPRCTMPKTDVCDSEWDEMTPVPRGSANISNQETREIFKAMTGIDRNGEVVGNCDMPKVGTPGTNMKPKALRISTWDASSAPVHLASISQGL